MSRRLYLVVGATLLLFAIGAGVVLVSSRGSDSDEVDYSAVPGPLRSALEDATRATAGFDHFTQARISVGGKCGRVLVADSQAERVLGLRAVRDLGPYDGMLFVFDESVLGRFTMADTLIPLDIEFYDSDGQPLRHLRMVPCKNGDDATCPIYDPRVRFRYALETTAGSAQSGSLGGCG